MINKKNPFSTTQFACRSTPFDDPFSICIFDRISNRLYTSKNSPSGMFAFNVIWICNTLNHLKFTHQSHFRRKNTSSHRTTIKPIHYICALPSKSAKTHILYIYIATRMSLSHPHFGDMILSCCVKQNKHYAIALCRCLFGIIYVPLSLRSLSGRICVCRGAPNRKIT